MRQVVTEQLKGDSEGSFQSLHCSLYIHYTAAADILGKRYLFKESVDLPLQLEENANNRHLPDGQSSPGFKTRVELSSLLILKQGRGEKPPS